MHDLDAMDIFYKEVFGIVELFRHEDRMLGRDISEIGYQATYQGGPSLTLIKYLDSEGPLAGESVQGFMTAPLVADPEMRKLIDSMTPMGRMGQAEEVAEAVVWLCSHSASFVTGHPLVIDGGATAI